jgi:DNA-binding transcriptional ArsR family regulator
MEAFDVLGDPVRRRILEFLSSGERTAGEVASTIGSEFGLTQPAISRHLRVLRESGFASARPVGTRRLYALDPAGLDEAHGWLADLRQQWAQRLDALGTELARGRRQQLRADTTGATAPDERKEES